MVLEIIIKTSAFPAVILEVTTEMLSSPDVAIRSVGLASPVPIQESL